MTGEWELKQPRHIIDLVWDRYMELDPRGPGKRFVDLALTGLSPHDVTAMFDIAITAYREEKERESDRGTGVS